MTKKITITDPKVTSILDRFSASKDFRRPFESKWTGFYKDFRNQLETEQSGRSNLFIPYTFQTIETILPRIIANRPKLFVLPKEPNDRTTARIMQALLDYQWTQVGMESKIEDMVLSGLLYGLGILKIGWDEKEENPTAEFVDLLNFYPDPDATNPDNMKWAFLRTMRTKDYIKAKYGFDLPKDFSGGDPERVGTDKESISHTGPDNKRTTEDQLVEVLEFWTPESLVVIVGRQFIVRDLENPANKLPFCFYQDYLTPSEFYPIGEVEHIHMLQEEANTLRNQIMDNNNLLINRMWKVRKSGGVNPRNLVSRPGGVVAVNLMDDIEPLDMPGLPNYVFQLQETIKGDIQQTTGVTDYQVGPASGNNLNSTATGVSLIQEAGNQRFKMKIRHLERTLRDIGNMFIFLNQSLITQEKVIRIVGEAGVQFQKISDSSDLLGNFDLSTEAGSTRSIDPEKEIVKFQVFTQFASAPMFAPYIKWREVLQAAADKFDIPDSERFIKTDQEIEEEQTQGDYVGQMSQLPPDLKERALATLNPDQRTMLEGEMHGQERGTQTSNQPVA